VLQCSIRIWWLSLYNHMRSRYSVMNTVTTKGLESVRPGPKLVPHVVDQQEHAGQHQRDHDGVEHRPAMGAGIVSNWRKKPLMSA